MTSATVTSKGQITIPALVRAKLGIATGSKIEFVQLANDQFAIVPATLEASSLKGMLRKPDKPVSIQKMNEAISQRGASAK